MKSLRLSFIVALLSGVLYGQQQTKDSVTTVSLEEVKVVGLRANQDTPVTFTNITKKELERRNLGQDIPILLNYLPSVVTTSDAGAGVGYTGIRVRGSDASRVNITINGIPYNDSESQGTFWVNLPDFASSVETFQLQRGVGTSTNGSGAFGASLNLITDVVSDVAYAETANSMGSFNTFKNTLKFSTGRLGDHLEISGRFSKINSDGYVDRARANLSSYFLQASYKDDNTLIKAIAFGGHEITYQSWYGVDAITLVNNRTYNPAGEIYDDVGNVTSFYDNQVDDYTQDHYQFHWNQKLNPFWNFSLGLNYTYGRGFYEEYNDLWYTQNITFGDEVAFSYLGLTPLNYGTITIDTTENVTRKWLDNDYYVATLGAQYTKNDTKLYFGGMYSKYIGDHFGALIWAQQAGNVLPNHRFYENQGIKTETNFYAKGTQRLNNQLSIYVDLQLRTIDYTVAGEVKGPEAFSVEDQFTFFNPKAGLTYRIADQQQLYFSYAKAQREPNRTDYENGSPRPEVLNDFELGWRAKTDKAEWQANMYWMAYKDQLVLTGALDAVGSPIRENVGNSRRIGLEIEAKFQLGSQWLWQPNIALSSNKNSDYFFQRDGVTQELGDTNLSFSPNIIAGNAIIFAPSTSFQMGLLSKYVGEQYMGNIDSENSKLPAYFVSDLNATYTINPKSLVKEMQFSLLVNNIFNKKYESNGYFYTYDDDFSTPGVITTIEGAGYYPQAGTHFLAGIRMLF